MGFTFTVTEANPVDGCASSVQVSVRTYCPPGVKELAGITNATVDTPEETWPRTAVLAFIPKAVEFPSIDHTVEAPEPTVTNANSLNFLFANTTSETEERNTCGAESSTIVRRA